MQLGQSNNRLATDYKCRPNHQDLWCLLFKGALTARESREGWEPVIFQDAGPNDLLPIVTAKTLPFLIRDIVSTSRTIVDWNGLVDCFLTPQVISEPITLDHFSSPLQDICSFFLKSGTLYQSTDTLRCSLLEHKYLIEIPRMLELLGELFSHVSIGSVAEFILLSSLVTSCGFLLLDLLHARSTLPCAMIFF